MICGSCRLQAAPNLAWHDYGWLRHATTSRRLHLIVAIHSPVIYHVSIANAFDTLLSNFIDRAVTTEDSTLNVGV